VLLNLLLNSLEAMPNGGRMEASTAITQDMMLIRVHDTGCGMSHETAARIFEPFFTTKEVGSGTGLGLHIVKREIERHYGQISVESTSGQGTSFVLRFPPTDIVVHLLQESTATESVLVRSAS